MNSADRRRLLQLLLLGGLSTQARAFWFSDDEDKPRQQIHKISGEVTVSGQPATESTVIVPGIRESS